MIRRMIRLATVDDASAIREIYRPAIEDSVISFEAEVPTVEQMQARIAGTLQTHPWLVFEDEQGVCGYAYAGPHHPRAAYRWTANVSVYIDSRVHRQGIARKLYDVLFKILRMQNVRQVIAGITIPNPSSHAFHQELGFKQIGLYPSVGYKLGQWLDVSWWQLELVEKSEESPGEFLLFPSLVEKNLSDLL